MRTLLLLLLLSLIFPMHAFACVDAGVSAYFSKNEATEENVREFASFIKKEYMVDVQKQDRYEKYFLLPKDGLEKDMHQCFSHTFTFLNGSNKITISWFHKNVFDDSVVKRCDVLFENMIKNFQSEEGIKEDVELYRGC